MNKESLALDQAAWYNTNFGMKMGNILTEEVRKKQGQLMNPEDIYQIDNNNHTYATLNEQPGIYDGSPGALKLDLRQRGQEKDEAEIIDG